MRRPALGLAIAGLCVSAASCSHTQTAKSVSTPPQATAPAAAAASGVAVPVPHDDALANVYRMEGSDGRIISGGVPEGDAGFEELRRMGIRTIISVDGASPDVARAAAHGMRYIHIPVTYADVPDPQRMEIAKAIEELPGPIYIHCHHGKHRAAAAAAAVGVTLGFITPDQGVSYMKTAGTSPNYTGLYHCVATAQRATPEELAATPDDFKPVQKARGITGAMVETDEVFEHLSAVRGAGWTVPKNHPDLVPAAEAGRLVDLFRIAGEDPRAQALGPDFMSKLKHAIDVSSQLETSIVEHAPADRIEANHKLVAASCEDCHAKYRNKRVR